MSTYMYFLGEKYRSTPNITYDGYEINIFACDPEVCLGKTTLFKTASSSRHVTSLGAKHRGKMIEDTKEAVPIFPHNSLLYAL